jgi:3-oxoacyl-[acyl-carrier-protein] synthase-3
MDINFNKFLTNIESIGNTSAASIPILIDDINSREIIKSGEYVILCGFGAGINYGAILLKWK